MARLSRTNSPAEQGVGSGQWRMCLCEEEGERWRSPLPLPPHAALLTLKKVANVC